MEVGVFWLLIFFLKFKNDIKKYKSSFDVIWIINYQFIRENGSFIYPRFSIEDLNYVSKGEPNIYLSACGIDYPYCLYASELKKLYVEDLSNSFYKRTSFINKFDKLIPIVKGVIPVMYEYSYVHRRFNHPQLKVFQTIPLAINTTKIKAIKNIVQDKIVIFFGVNRKAKGTEHVLTALDFIKTNYGDLVDIKIVHRVPFVEYIELLSQANILIDQCYSYSYGMNALYGLALGKVVLSGNEPECSEEFGCSIPIVNIQPQAQDIISKLQFFIKNPDQITLVSQKSRLFVEKNHDSSIIAKQYCKIFLS